MTRNLDSIISEINKVCMAFSFISRVYLYGSYVYGKPNELSDLDFLIVVDDHCQPIEVHRLIRKRLDDKINKPIDFHIVRNHEFFCKRKHINNIENLVYKWGKKVYERA